MSGGTESHKTKDDGTETTNLEWEYTSIYTQHRFAADNKPLKYVKVKSWRGYYRRKILCKSI